jgi:hypothetical protein
MAWYGTGHRRLVLSVFLAILISVVAWLILRAEFGPSRSPLVVKAGPAVGVPWPDGQGTVGVSVALPSKVLVNQSYVFDAHVTFFVMGPNISPPVLENPDYDMFVRAHLDSAAFDIKPTTPESQPAKSGLMSWGWMVLPKQPGRQPFLLTMEVEYKSKLSGQLLPAKPLWSNGLQLVDVEEPLFKRGQIDLLSILLGALGSLATNLVERFFSKRKARVSKVSKPATPSSSP